MGNERMTTKNLCSLIAAGADLLDEQAAAALLTVAPGTLGVWRSTGRYNLPFLKVGRMVRYRRADLLAWLEKRTRETGSTA
jgi:predicted site-specific integrase-resolvase